MMYVHSGGKEPKTQKPEEREEREEQEDELPKEKQMKCMQ
jgi:hypothetical protein